MRVADIRDMVRAWGGLRNAVVRLRQNKRTRVHGCNANEVDKIHFIMVCVYTEPPPI
jgi:hypothetical protein